MTSAGLPMGHVVYGRVVALVYQAFVRTLVYQGSV